MNGRDNIHPCPRGGNSAEWATPAIDALVSFAEKRRLTLNNPAIENWTELIADSFLPRGIK